MDSTDIQAGLLPLVSDNLLNTATAVVEATGLKYSHAANNIPNPPLGSYQLLGCKSISSWLSRKAARSIARQLLLLLQANP